METVKLNNLEWMAENLTGHGGVERDGNWYYTWEQAIKAAEEIGDGWRLPTEDEIKELSTYYMCTMWDDGMYFGGHEELFLRALGRLPDTSSAVIDCSEGFYWSDFSYSIITDTFKPCLHFSIHDYVDYDDFQFKRQYFSVILVRNIKK